MRYVVKIQLRKLGHHIVLPNCTTLTDRQLWRLLIWKNHNKHKEKDYDPNKDYSRIPKIKDRDKGTSPVVLLDENNNILQEFYSVNNAGKELALENVIDAMDLTGEVITTPFTST